MRILAIILLFSASVMAKQPFTTEDFIKKHNLNLPEITSDLLDTSKHIHRSDLWEYFYLGKTDKLDSVFNYRTLQAYHDIKHYQIYEHSNDSTFVERFSIAQDNFDTTSHSKRIVTENGLVEKSTDLKRNCTWYHKRQPWANQKIYELSQCPGDSAPRGQVIDYKDHGDYIEAIETYKGKVDSNTIRRFYFTNFDSVVADYIVKSFHGPRLMSLYRYTKQHKMRTAYHFNFYDTLNLVTRMAHYEYDEKNRVSRIYNFYIISRSDPAKGYKMTNYTNVEYDSLGRKTKETTWVVPNPEYDKIVPKETDKKNKKE